MTQPSPGAKRRIAILGSRGIPAEFGGFETFAEQLAVRLVAAGFEVTVFCEGTQSYREPEYKSVRLVYINTPNIVGLRSIWFDLVSIIRCLRGHDVVYMLGYHAAFAFVLPWMFRTDFWTNMDGLEWRRAKWSPGARLYLRLMERIAARFSRRLIADAQGIADHLQSSYGVGHKTRMVPYGAEPVQTPPNADLIEEWSLPPREYFLVVCRLEPENHVQEIIDGFVASETSRKLIVVGDHRGGTAYVQSLLDAADDRVVFVGTIYDQARLTALRWYCRAYFHGHSVGGTNPSLLEAMGCANHTIAHDNVFNREVTGGHADFFSAARDIPPLLRELDASVPDGPGRALRERVREVYNWDRVARIYADLFRR